MPQPDCLLQKVWQYSAIGEVATESRLWPLGLVYQPREGVVSTVEAHGTASVVHKEELPEAAVRSFQTLRERTHFVAVD